MLLLAEDEDRLAEASDLLATAAALAPANPRIHYNYGLSLQRLGRPGEAEKSLKTACRLAPGETDFLYALAVLYSQQEQWEQAIKCAEELVARRPNDRQMRALLEHVRQRQPEP